MAVTVRDTVAPRITGVASADGVRGVWRYTNVAATFSEAMDARTLTGATVRLRRHGSTTSVPPSVRYDAARRRAVLDPRSALARGATYTARVGSGARDDAGNALPATRRWSFTVRR